MPLAANKRDNMTRSIIPGQAEAAILPCQQGLSFWGGVNAETGLIIDRHHPLAGQSVSGKVLAMPTSRGSCTGSGVLLELIRNGQAPAALVFQESESILTLGALVARHVFGQTIPVIQLSERDYAIFCTARHAIIDNDRLVAGTLDCALPSMDASALSLSECDRRMLEGKFGTAAQTAMRILYDMAVIENATHLVDVAQVHIDGCIYASPALLRFAEIFAEMGAKVRVPTTMNSISVDYAHWRSQGVPSAFGEPAARLADVYVEMGAKPSFTCAPYLLDTQPTAGEVVAWAESNAVIYANSVLGARTAKHPDLLDLCIALTGRSPYYGVYLDEHRRARRIIDVAPLAEDSDDAFWPLLGYLAGQLSPDRIPVIRGVASMSPSDDDLKALCAAFGTTSAAPMLHVEGITPEADRVAEDADRVAVSTVDLARVWRQLNASPEAIELVAFGSPHFSLQECRRLAALMAGRHCADSVTTIVTLGRDTLERARNEGLADRLTAAGVRLHADLCWCSISEPVFPTSTRALMTNSGKYAHYGPGLSGRAVRFGSLAECVEAACSGKVSSTLPKWLEPERTA